VDNPETVSTLGTQERWRRQTKHTKTKQHRKLKITTRTHQKPGENRNASESLTVPQLSDLFFLPLLTFFVRNDQGHVQFCRWIVNNTHIQAKLVLWRITFHSWSLYFRSFLGLDRMVLELATTDAISAYHHNVVNSNPAHDEMYSLQDCVIMLVSDVREIGGLI